MKFINLRNYSENSILNAAVRVKDLISKAKELKLPALALSDKNAYGMVDFYINCIMSDIKPLFGFNVKSPKDGDKRHNVILYPLSAKGQKNIFKIVTLEATDEINSLFDLTKEQKKLLEDVLVIIDFNDFQYSHNEYKELLDTSNMYVEIQPRNDEDDFNKAKELIGIENIIITSPTYYLDEIVIQDIEKYTDSEGNEQEQINFEVTGDDVMKIMKAIEDNVEVESIEDDFEGLHFKTEQEVRTEFDYISDEEFDKIKENIANIVDLIEFDLMINVPQIPVFEIEGENKKIYEKYKHLTPDMTSDEWFLRYIVYSNLEERYKVHLEFDEILEMIHKEFTPKIEGSLSSYSIPDIKKMSMSTFSEKKKDIIKKINNDELIQRIEYELFVIHTMGFDAYFLIVYDYINYARSVGIEVGPGRGSAAGSIVAYLTKITNIEPLRYDLLFERFLSPSRCGVPIKVDKEAQALNGGKRTIEEKKAGINNRMSLPDIDTDFSDRDELIQYASRKYGKEKVAPVITFGKLSAKSVLKGVGRAEGVPFHELNRLTQLFTNKESGAGLAKIYENNQNFRNAVDASATYTNIYKKALQLEGFKQQTGTHACAVIIAPHPMTDYCPIQYPVSKSGTKNTDIYVTELEGGDLELQGLLKMDFLGLNTLSIIKNTLDIIKKHHNKEIDMMNLDLGDEKVYDTVFKTGNTTDVFQFESQGMKKHLKNLEASNFEDLIAMVSLYRPGPMQFIDTYIAVKKGLQEPQYKDPKLREILEITHSVCIYQEQIMKISQELAGYTLGEADVLRRAIGKKKKKVILEQRDVFCRKGAEQGRDPEIIGEIYDDVVLPAAEYSFNKSHAACYAFIAFQTAWLKTYYPAEFAVGNMMTDNGSDLKRLKVTLEDALLNDIEIIPLNINTSEVEFTYRGGKKIEVGFKAIKGVGEKALVPIIEEREANGKFKDFKDFFIRTKEHLNKKVLQGLLKSGALLDLIETNKGLENLDKLLKAKKKKPKKKKGGETDVFALFETNEDTGDIIDWSDTEPANNLELSILEEESIGLMLRFHPLDGIAKYLKGFDVNRELLYRNKSTKTLAFNDKRVELLGIMTDFYEGTSYTGEKRATIKLLGSDYIIRCNLNKTLYYNNVGKLKNSVNTLVRIGGTFSINNYGRGIYISDIEFKDINKAYKAAEAQGQYSKKDKCSWKKIHEYYNKDLKVVDPLFVNIDRHLLKKENANKLNSLLTELKTFLDKNYDPNGQFEIILKTDKVSEQKNTGMIINKNKKDTLANKINTLSGLTLHTK